MLVDFSFSLLFSRPCPEVGGRGGVDLQLMQKAKKKRLFAIFAVKEQSQ